MHVKYTRINEVHRSKRISTFSHRFGGFRFRLQILDSMYYTKTLGALNSHWKVFAWVFAFGKLAY
jgi:hypothetical protein